VSSGKKLKLNVRISAAKNLPSVRALWGTKIHRYAKVTFAGDTLETESAEGQSPRWGSVHALEFGARGIANFETGDIKISIFEKVRTRARRRFGSRPPPLTNPHIRNTTRSRRP
jgi:hypothetical protein